MTLKLATFVITAWTFLIQSTAFADNHDANSSIYNPLAASSARCSDLSAANNDGGASCLATNQDDLRAGCQGMDDTVQDILNNKHLVAGCQMKNGKLDFAYSCACNRDVSATIVNTTDYIAEYDVMCAPNSAWVANALNGQASATSTCRDGAALMISFKKSWLAGCPNTDQTYTVTPGTNYFAPTACGMELYFGQPTPPGPLVFTIENNTQYTTYYEVQCDSSVFTSYSLEPSKTSTLTCPSAKRAMVEFKKSWLEGCTNVDQIYTMVPGVSHFAPTACGMDFFTGS